MGDNSDSQDSQNDIPEGYILSRFRSDFLDAAGPIYVKPEGDRQFVGMRVKKGQTNHVGTAHGGVLATLADVALSLQVHESADPPLPVVTLSLTTNFLAGAQLGDWVEVRAKIDRIGKKFAYCSAELWSKDRLVMTATGVFTIIRKNKG